MIRIVYSTAARGARRQRIFEILDRTPRVAGADQAGASRPDSKGKSNCAASASNTARAR